MPKIKNYDQASIYNGYAANEWKYHNDMFLIQIFDPNCTLDFPKTVIGNVVSEYVQFEFLDVDETIEYKSLLDFAITQEQANEIHNILKECLENDEDVLVHCFMGVCRSGAVVQHAVDMGFEDPEIYRAPNQLVLKKLRIAAGTYKDEDYFDNVFKEN